MSRSGIDVLATVKDGFAKRFAFKPLTASVRVDEWPGRGQLGIADLSGQDQSGAPRARSLWPPSDSPYRDTSRLLAPCEIQAISRLVAGNRYCWRIQ